MSEPDTPSPRPPKADEHVPPTRPAAAAERPARPGDAVLFCAVFLAAQLVLGLLAGIYSAATGSPVGNLGMALLEAGSFFLVLPFARRRLRLRIMPLFRRREPALPVYLCIVVMVVGAVPGFAVLDALLGGLVRLPDFFRATEVLLLNPDDRLGALLLACLAAPVFEEVLFRGIILGGLALTRGTVRGLLAASALFAVVHTNPLLLPAAFLLGLLLGAVYLRTGSLVAAILMHTLYNAGALALAWLPGAPVEMIGGTAVPLATKLGVIGLGLGVAALGAWLLLRATARREGGAA
jgi:membrane protease YdiL (CAAX protease family)